MFELLRVALMSAFGGAILGLALGLSSPLMARGRRSLAVKRAKLSFPSPSSSWDNTAQFIGQISQVTTPRAWIYRHRISVAICVGGAR